MPARYCNQSSRTSRPVARRFVDRVNGHSVNQSRHTAGGRKLLLHPTAAASDLRLPPDAQLEFSLGSAVEKRGEEGVDFDHGPGLQALQRIRSATSRPNFIALVRFHTVAPASLFVPHGAPPS